MTDPLLLDAVEDEWRRSASRTRVIGPPRIGADDAVPTGMRRIETPFSGAVDVPAGPEGAVGRALPDERGRWVETPFSGAVLLDASFAQPRPSARPVGTGPTVRPPRAGPAPQVLSPRSAPPLPAALERPAPPAAPTSPPEGPGPVAPRSLPALLAAGPQSEAAGTGDLGRARPGTGLDRPAEEDDAQRAEDALRDPVEVGLSGRSLAMGLAVGLGLAVVLSIVAVLPV